MIDYFTGSKFRININSNLVFLMMPQPQNYYFEAAGCRFCNFFAGVPQNEDPLCPPNQIEDKFLDNINKIFIKYFSSFLVIIN